MNPALTRWRQELAAQAGLTAEIRRELEAHLHDCMAGFQRLGLSAEESFQLACQRIGQPQQLRAEFNKVMNQSSHWNPPLTVAAWAVFMVSFFLPSYTTMSGWQCAILQHTFWPAASQGDFLSIHYELLLLANLVMLASPLLLTQFSRNVRQLQWLHHLTLATAVFVWAFALELLIRGNAAGLRIGYFAWSFSFTLLYVSVRSQLSHWQSQIACKHA
jgi:hypothetical protein